MTWEKRKEVWRLPIAPVGIALSLLAAAATIYVASTLAKFHTLSHISMVMVLLSLLLSLAGWKILKALLLPVLFLLFMFPIPSAYYVLVTNPLKLFITDISMHIIHLMNIPVYREGNLLFLASTQLEVAEACSGIRSLYSYLMLACLFAFMSRKRISKIILLISTLPLAFFVNILRVAGTGVLADFFGSEVAHGFFHQFTGIVLFVFGFVVLFLEYRFLESYSPQRH
jgi:exosortase